MILHRAKGLRTFGRGISVGGAYVLFWIYYALIVNLIPFYGNLDLTSYFSFSCGIPVGLTFFYLSSKSRSESFMDQTGIGQCLRAMLYVAVCMLFIIVAGKNVEVSRFVCFAYLPLLVIYLYSVDQLIAPRLSEWIFHNKRTQRTLFVGSPRKLAPLVSWIKNSRRVGLEPMGLICDENTPDTIHGLPVLGGSDDIFRVIAEQGINTIILLEIPRLTNVAKFFIKVIEEKGIRLVILNDLPDIIGHSLVYYSHESQNFICLRNEPLEDPINRALKRLLDIVISAPVVFFILPPLALVTWAVQRIQSPGPLFYSQARAGLNNRAFSIYKLRTMHVHKLRLHDHTKANDPRVYPFARILRKTNLDEFPQFFNVLMGTMSLVGPRPHMITHNDDFARVVKNYHIRSYIKPGLTGLAQVRGYRGDVQTNEDVEQRVKSDLEYIESWSIGLDLKLIAQTFLTVIFPQKNAN